MPYRLSRILRCAGVEHGDIISYKYCSSVRGGGRGGEGGGGGKGVDYQNKSMSHITYSLDIHSVSSLTSSYIATSMNNATS